MITLPELPYASDALAPVISAQTLSFHHGKHHKAYVDKTNELVANTPLANASLEEIIRTAAADPAKKGLFNQSAQVWNHTFYWNGLKPGGGGAPTGKLGELIPSAFGSYENFKNAFVDAGMTQFGSGWAWLVAEGGALKIVKTKDADVPFVNGQTPLLTLDVWEHAYYLDFQNRRKDYLTAALEKLVNWDFANQNLPA